MLTNAFRCQVPKDSTYNLSSDKPVQLRYVVDKIYATSTLFRVDHATAKCPLEMTKFSICGSNEMLKVATGWQPLVNIDVGIKQTQTTLNHMDSNNEYQATST